MDGAYGGTYCAPMWAKFFAAALKDEPHPSFKNFPWTFSPWKGEMQAMSPSASRVGQPQRHAEPRPDQDHHADAAADQDQPPTPQPTPTKTKPPHADADHAAEHAQRADGQAGSSLVGASVGPRGAGDSGRPARSALGTGAAALPPRSDPRRRRLRSLRALTRPASRSAALPRPSPVLSFESQRRGRRRRAARSTPTTGADPSPTGSQAQHLSGRAP